MQAQAPVHCISTFLFYTGGRLYISRYSLQSPMHARSQPRYAIDPNAIAIPKPNRAQMAMVIYQDMNNAIPSAAPNTTIPTGSAAAVEVVPQHCRLYVTPFAFAATSNTEPWVGRPML